MLSMEDKKETASKAKEIYATEKKGILENIRNDRLQYQSLECQSPP